MSVQPTRRRKYTRLRGPQHSKWVNDPLRNEMLDAMAKKEWSISDLGRAIGSQPSLVSRWMMGATPNPESVGLISEALGLDYLRLMELAGHIPPQPREDDEDPEMVKLQTKLGQVSLTPERIVMLHNLFESMLKTPVATPSPSRQDRGSRAA